MDYAEWTKKIGSLKKELLARPNLLRQYALWLETSEEHTSYKGKDIYDRLEGAMQALSDIDFIPGLGRENLVVVLSEIQREMDLDLGVCEHLAHHIKFNKQKGVLGTTTDDMPRCTAHPGLIVADLSSCLPPQRTKCPYRRP